MMSALLLSSGGLDSTTVAYWLHKQQARFRPLFFDYGQHCVEKEWGTLRAVLPDSERIAAPLRVDISAIYQRSNSRLILEADLWSEYVDVEDLYIPYRTLLFFTVSACIAQTLGLTTVYSGFVNSNHAKELDCSATFLNGWTHSRAMSALSDSRCLFGIGARRKSYDSQGSWVSRLEELIRVKCLVTFLAEHAPIAWSDSMRSRKLNHESRSIFPGDPRHHRLRALDCNSCRADRNRPWPVDPPWSSESSWSCSG
jgi:7-cyano-7-deazaguanine synthase in queuosine biosynthesis